MTFTYLILPEIICLIIFAEFPSFVYVSKLSILSIHAEYLKGLLLCYVLSFFLILKSLYTIGQLTYLEEDNFSLRESLLFMKKLGRQGIY